MPSNAMPSLMSWTETFIAIEVVFRIDERVPFRRQAPLLEDRRANRTDRRHVGIGGLDIDGNERIGSPKRLRLAFPPC
ncbi:MAG: hypothetical protein ACSLE4_08880 [Methyloceanibacter sp.]|uniref:hypothetical protein n=1 Tax=Methyloceanibacter sp. TaxID=1965321 RepID=UPI003EDF60AC